jgi:hypothetical protein
MAVRQRPGYATQSREINIMDKMHTLVSSKMDVLTERAKKFLKSEGLLYPALYLLRKGSPIVTDYKHPIVINMESEETEGDVLTLDQMYSTIVILKNACKEDEQSMGVVARELVRATDPDAVAVIMAVTYKEFSTKDFKNLAKEYSPNRDPEAISAIHTCYYVRGDKTPGLSIIPYVNRSGEIEASIPGVNDDQGRDIHFFNAPWLVNEKKIDPWFKYPY